MNNTTKFAMYYMAAFFAGAGSLIFAGYCLGKTLQMRKG